MSRYFDELTEAQEQVAAAAERWETARRAYLAEAAAGKIWPETDATLSALAAAEGKLIDAVAACRALI